MIRLFFVCYFSVQIVNGCGCGKDSYIDDYEIPSIKPIVENAELPPQERKRTQTECDEYKAKILATLSPNGRKEDPNFIMTGQVCADGYGSIYEA